MSAYSAVRVGKLRLKGPASGALKGKKKRKRKRESREDVNEEDLRHGVVSTCVILSYYDSHAQEVGGE